MFAENFVLRAFVWKAVSPRISVILRIECESDSHTVRARQKGMDRDLSIC